MTDLPEDAVDAERIERRVVQQLERLDADFDVVRIDPAFARTADFCQRYGYAPEISVNCIVVVTKSAEPRHAACLVQATRRLDVNGTVRRLLGVRKASFAPAEQTVALTGMLPDGVTPFGLPPELPIYVDAPVTALERIILGGGSRGLKLLVPPAAVLSLPGASAIEGLSFAPG